MSEWTSGDLALCVHSGGWENDGLTDILGPTSGEINLVREVGMYEDTVILWLDDYSGDELEHAFVHMGFVKVTPEKPDEFDREVIDAMKEKVVHG